MATHVGLQAGAGLAAVAGVAQLAVAGLFIALLRRLGRRGSGGGLRTDGERSYRGPSCG